MQSLKPIELIILPPFNIEYRCGTVTFILLHTGMQVNYKEFFSMFYPIIGQIFVQYTQKPNIDRKILFFFSRIIDFNIVIF